MNKKIFSALGIFVLLAVCFFLTDEHVNPILNSWSFAYVMIYMYIKCSNIDDLSIIAQVVFKSLGVFVLLGVCFFLTATSQADSK